MKKWVHVFPYNAMVAPHAPQNLGRRGPADHRSLLELSHQQVRKWWCGREMAFGLTWDPREGIAFGSTWDALGL